MHPTYEDITSRIATPPLWFDENAVPRYGQFAPDRSASIYINEIVLAEISCQHCRQRFKVALSPVNVRVPHIQRASDVTLPDGTTITRASSREVPIADAIRVRTLSYGDPPHHEDPRDAPGHCIGASMTTQLRRVLEYWRKGPGPSNWKRDPNLEVEFPEADDD